MKDQIYITSYVVRALAGAVIPWILTTVSCINSKPQQDAPLTVKSTGAGANSLRHMKMIMPGRGHVIGRMDPVVTFVNKKPEIKFVLSRAAPDGRPKMTLDLLEPVKHTEVASRINRVDFTKGEHQGRWVTSYSSYGGGGPLEGNVIEEEDFFSKEFPEIKKKYSTFSGMRVSDYTDWMLIPTEVIGLSLEKPAHQEHGFDIIVTIESLMEPKVGEGNIVYDENYKIAGWILPSTSGLKSRQHRFISVHSATVRRYMMGKSPQIMDQTGDFTASQAFQSYFCSADQVERALQERQLNKPCLSETSSAGAMCTPIQQFSEAEVMAKIAEIIEAERASKARARSMLAECQRQASAQGASPAIPEKCVITAAEVQKALEKKLTGGSSPMQNQKSETPEPQSWIPSTIANDAIVGHCPVAPLSWKLGKRIYQFCKPK